MKRNSNFNAIIIKTTAQRVGYKCSNPDCRTLTAGPNSDFEKSTLTGEAAHICAAQPGGARYNSDQSDEERKSIKNAIWLCSNCHKLVDRDPQTYTINTLLHWKSAAEKHALKLQVTKSSDYKLKSDSIETEEFKKGIRWFHETTEDKNYVIRTNVLKKLNKHYNDKKTKVITVTGIGGAGKTSLIGNWLKINNSKLKRDMNALFYWSFYSDVKVDMFLKHLCSFLEKCFFIDFNLDKNKPLMAITNNFANTPGILLVLDGLEILQEAISEGKSYGAFIDAKLRDLILCITSSKENWLCITTSRFPLTDLQTRKNVKNLSVDRVEVGEGADILNRNSVFGNESDRKEIVRFFEGHALTLRIFAASIPIEKRHNPLDHLHFVFQGASPNNFIEKLNRLLVFYSNSINEKQRTILSILSIFRSHISAKLIIKLVPGFSENVKPIMSNYISELGKLVATGLIIRDYIDRSTVFACHPIIRDFFRSNVLNNNQGAGIFTIDYITRRPDDVGFQNVTNTEPFLIAIETLLDMAGTVYRDEALKLFNYRLNRGGIFLELGFPKEGKRCYRAFLEKIANLSFRKSLRIFNENNIYFFYNGYIEFCLQLGEFRDAEKILNTMLKEFPNYRKSIPLRSIARLSYYKGEYPKAVDFCRKAIKSTKLNINDGSADESAITYYFLIMSLLKMDLVDEAKDELKKLNEIRPLFEQSYADSYMASFTAEHSLFIYEKNDERISYYNELIIDTIPKIKNKTLYFEFIITLIEGLIFRQAFATAMKYVEEIHEYAVSRSCPYYLSKAIYLKEYLSYLEKGGCNISRIEDVIDITTSNGNLSVKIDAMMLKSKLLNNDDKKDLEEEAIGIADLIGYASIVRNYL